MGGTPGNSARPTVPQWPLIARDDELEAITEVIDPQGPPGLVIVGPAGVGRTRLLEEALDLTARAEWAGYGIRGIAPGRGVSFGPFAGTDTNATVLKAFSTTQQTDDAVADLAGVAAGQSAVFGIDDAHLLDEKSMYALCQMLHRGMAKTVITARTGRSPSDAILRLWKDGVLRRLDVDTLHRHRCDELVCAALGGEVSNDCLSALWELSRGNLVYLRHLLDHEVQRGNLVQIDQIWELRDEPDVSPALRDLLLVETGCSAGPLWDVVDIVAATKWIEHRCLVELVDRQAVAEAERAGLVTTIENRAS